MTVWQRFRKFLLRSAIRYVEKRASLKDADGWLYDALTGGGASTASGQTVSPNTALTLSSYFAAVRAIAEDIGKIPLILYRRKDERTKDRATGHPLYRILHDTPNPDMSAMDFRSCMTANAVNWGNGYAEIQRNGTGQVLNLWPLESSKMSIERDDAEKLYYIYRDGGKETRLAQREVLHLRGLASNGIQGYSIARLARESLGMGLAEIKAGAAFFGNNSRPAGVLESPGPDPGRDKKDAFREQWEARYKGPDAVGSTAILYGGMTFKPLSVSNEDAQFIESRQLTVEDMARWLRVPPHIIGHLLRATFSNIEHQSIEYVQHCLMSWAVRWEQEIQRKLISPRERNVFAEHLFDGLLRADIKTRYGVHAIRRQWGLASANDIHRLENTNPIGPAGDVYLVPANMMNADRLLEANTDVVDTTGGNSGNGEPDSEATPTVEEEKESARWLGLAERLFDRIDINAARVAATNSRNGNGNGNGSRTTDARGGRTS